MIQKAMNKAVLLGLALTMLLACKASPPAEEAPPFVPIELLEAGAEPRSVLRFKIAEGTTTTSTVLWQTSASEGAGPGMTVSGLKSMMFKAKIGPAKTVENEIHIKSEIIESEATAGPGADERLVRQIDAHDDYLKGVGSTDSMDDRGRLLGLRLNQKAADVPLRIVWTVENAFALLSVIPLPDEEIGIGGRWISRNMLSLYGIKMVQEATYTLLERNGDEILLAIEWERIGERQVLDFEEEESLVEVKSARLEAEGRIRLDLRTLGANSAVSGTVDNNVVIVEQGKRETRHVHEDFELEVRSTTELP